MSEATLTSRADRSGRGWFLWVLGATFGLFGTLAAVGAVVTPLDRPEWLPDTLAVELALRSAAFVIGGLFVATAVGLLRLRRWAFYLAAAWGAFCLILLVVWNLDPERSALLVMDFFALLMAAGFPYLILRRRRFLDPQR